MTNKKISDKHINWLDFGIFFGSCMFVCGFSYEETLKVLKKKKSDGWITAFESTKDVWESGGAAFASKREMSPSGKIYFFLVLKDRFDFSDEHQRRLAHECIHLASFNISGTLNPMVENEAFAYLHTHLMKQCHDILRS